MSAGDDYFDILARLALEQKRLLGSSVIRDVTMQASLARQAIGSSLASDIMPADLVTRSAIRPYLDDFMRDAAYYKSSYSSAFDQLFATNLINDAALATRSLQPLLADRTALLGAADVIASRPAWHDSIASFRFQAEERCAASLALETHVDRMVSLANQARQSALDVSWLDFGSRLALPATDLQFATGAVDRFLTRYDDVMQTFGRLDAVSALPPYVSTTPPIATTTVTNFVGTVSDSDDEDFSIEERWLDVQQVDGFDCTTDDLLRIHHPDLLDKWRGALNAHQSGGPDWQAHLAASLRELLDHVLRRLAPDEEVKRWDPGRTDFYKGKASRRARILFICRELQHEPYSEFAVSLDGANKALIRAFNNGIHEPGSRIDEKEARALIAMAESHLRSLLRITHED